MSELVKSLREQTALKYMGNCKCMNCQLMPRPMIDAAADRIEVLEAALSEIVEECHNTGYGDPTVMERMIDRIEETASDAMRERQND